jgi:pre-mRNA-splicing factor SPF27
LANLELLDQFGKNAWLVGNSQLEDVLRSLEKDVVATQGRVDEVNKARKAAQEGVRGEMESLEQSWKKGIGRVVEVEVAAEGVRREVLETRRRGAGDNA